MLAYLLGQVTCHLLGYVTRQVRSPEVKRDDGVTCHVTGWDRSHVRSGHLPSQPTRQVTSVQTTQQRSVMNELPPTHGNKVHTATT